MVRSLILVLGVRFAFAACLLPKFSTFGYVGVPGPVPCVSEGSLQVGQACDVTCEANTTNVGGTTLFACGNGNVLVSPTLSCEPACTIPPFGRGIIGSTSPNAFPCSPGSFCRSCSCELACDASQNFTTGPGSSTYTCTSSGVLRGGTLRCFPCILPTNFNVSHLTTNASGPVCIPGAGLPNSTSCNLTCDSRYILNGNNQYSCDANAVLRAPNMTCDAQPCAVPTIMAPFAPGNCGSTLAPGDSCSVECDSRHSPTTGSANYTCESLIPAAPTLVCTPKNCTVGLPPGQNYAFDSSLPNACVDGGVLVSGSSCAITCALGFQALTGSATLQCNASVLTSSLVCQAANCAFFGTLPAGHVPINCALGTQGDVANATLVHGSSCLVGCASGYFGSSQMFSCAFGVISGPAPFCSPNSCTIPAFPSGFIADPNGPNNASCTQGGMLSSSSSCDVMCDNTTYTTSAGTTSYSCYLGNFIATPQAQCLPVGSCSYPTSLPCLQAQTCSMGTCTGTPLADGTSCNLGCVTTYSANTSLVGNMSCSSGSLSSTDDFCYPNSCLISFATLGIGGTGAGVTGCVDGGTLPHNKTCTLGCDPGLELVVPSQANTTIQCIFGTISVSPTSIYNQFCKTPHCTVPNSLPANIVFYPNTNDTSKCARGGVLESDPVEQSCALRCDQGFTGSPSYHCSQASGLNLVGSCVVQTCSYDVGTLVGVVAGNTTQCGEVSCDLTPGTHSLANGTCCDYQCEVGYHLANGSTTRLTCPTTPTNCGNFSSCSTTPSITQVHCEPNTCALPATFDAHVVAELEGANPPCYAHGVLAGAGVNSSCDVTCADGFAAVSGTATYSCTLGVLTAATLTCAPLGCMLPSLLPYQQEGVAGGPHDLPCAPDMELNSGESCDVGCPENSVNGTTAFSCLAGNLTIPTIICLAPSECLLPTVLGEGQLPTCTIGMGARLADGRGCDLYCDSGYVEDPYTSQTYSCDNGTLSIPDFACSPQPCAVSYSSPWIPSALADACNASELLLSGENCTLSCEPGYISRTIALSCNLGDVTVGSGSCVGTPCVLPALDPSMEAVCNTSQPLASGSQCVVRCKAGYYSNQSAVSCSLGVLTHLNLTCSPLPCSLSFALHEVADNSSGVGCGSSLSSGQTCETRCEEGFDGDSHYRYQCDLGNLTTWDGLNGLACVPKGCTIPPSVNPYVTNSVGCFPGEVISSGSNCSWGCGPTGFFDKLGSDLFSCYRGNFTSMATSLTCTPFACSLPTFGPDVTGVASDGVPACNLGAGILAHGANCSIGCENLTLSGGSLLSCSAGVLTRPPAICYDNTTMCALPLSLPMVGESLGNLFACDSLLNRGSSCRVGCASGYVPDGGTRLYTCNSAGVLSAPTLKCLGASCPVPLLTAQGLSTLCTPAPRADPSCAFGYISKNGSSSLASGVLQGRGGGEKMASCARCAALCTSLGSSCMSYQCSPSTQQCSVYSQYSPTSGTALLDFTFCFKTGAPCEYGYHLIPGSVLGNGHIGGHGANENVPCSMCAEYCSSQPSCLSYSCNHASQQCNLNTISTANAAAVADVTLCLKEAVPAPVPSGFLASGSTCVVQCGSGYVAAAYPKNQTTLLSCQGGSMSYPSLRCVAQPCTYPAQFPPSYGHANSGMSRCELGGSVAVGSSCLVGCAAGYYALSGTGAVTCNLGPNLTTPTLMCTPYLCSPPANPVGYQVSGCPANSSSAQCVVTCAAGYSTLLPNGPVSATCSAIGGTFALSGCLALPRCTTPVSSEYSVSCTGSSPYLSSACSAVCAAGFTGTASMSCFVSGAFTLSGCSSCVCDEGSGRSAGCNSSCVACPAHTYNNGSEITCRACPSGTCANTNRTGCRVCTAGEVGAGEEDEGISGGSIAAAVLVPLIVIGLVVGGVVYWKKNGGIEWRKKKATTAQETEMTSNTTTAELANAEEEP